MKYLTVFMMISFLSSMFCDILEVDVNGNYEFLEIQTAVETAVDGDTVLVYPGEYFENVNFLGKTIVLGSLYLLTGSRSYIRNTIINGNQESSCVIVLSGEGEGTTLCGFTLTNGSGYTGPDFASESGGGIVIFEASLILDNCIIENNSSHHGGGISCSHSNVLLKGVTVRNNQAFFSGGGIILKNDYHEIIFDEEDRCNIYNNYAGIGNDICSRYDEGVVDVIVDTLTSYDYWGYRVIQYWNSVPHIIDDGFSLEMENSWLTPIDGDLYVAPWGDNENSGLSLNDPLKSISWAMQQIASNETDPHTIHLADGVYSTSGTQEYFPIQIKGWVTVSGESSDNTILNGEMDHNLTRNYFVDGDVKLENLRLINASTDAYNGLDTKVISFNLNYNSEIFFENLVFENNRPGDYLILIESRSDVYMNNISVIGNGEDSDCTIMLSDCGEDDPVHFYLNNWIVRNNDNCKFVLRGRYDDTSFNFNNLLMSNNTRQYDCPITANYTSLAFSLWQSSHLTNCTIANNENEFPSPSSVILLLDGSNLDVTNCIVYDNNTDYFVLDYNFPDTELNIENSLFDFSPSELTSFGPTTVNYDAETIFSGDPMFTGQGDRPQTFQSGSPCIDAGTFDLPGNVILPDTDVYGNPRIYGNGIDIGAIEWQGTPIDFDDIVQKPMDIMVYPNPLIAGQLRDGQAKILWMGEYSADMQFDIFNVKGQCVRTLKIQNLKLKITASWDLKDDAGHAVSSGVYFVRMKGDGVYLAQRKVTLLQ